GHSPCRPEFGCNQHAAGTAALARILVRVAAPLFSKKLRLALRRHGEYRLDRWIYHLAHPPAFARQAGSRSAAHASRLLEIQLSAQALVEASTMTAPVGPLPKGDVNNNPPGIGFLALLHEDLRTHDRNFFEQGFWAVAVHRFGNWRMGIQPK